MIFYLLVVHHHRVNLYSYFAFNLVKSKQINSMTYERWYVYFEFIVVLYVCVCMCVS